MRQIGTRETFTEFVSTVNSKWTFPGYLPNANYRQRKVNFFFNFRKWSHFRWDIFSKYHVWELKEIELGLNCWTLELICSNFLKFSPESLKIFAEVQQECNYTKVLKGSHYEVPRARFIILENWLTILVDIERL